MKSETVKNNIIIGTLIIIVALMVIVFSPLNSSLKQSNNKYEKNWNVSITSVKKEDNLSSPTSEEIEKPSYLGTAFSFHVSLPPNTKIVYDVKVKNMGTMNGTFKSIFGNTQFNQQVPQNILCEIQKVDDNDTLLANTTHHFTVTITRADNELQQTEPLTKSGTIYFEYNSK